MHSVGEDDDVCASTDDDGKGKVDEKADGDVLIDTIDAGGRLIEGIGDGATAKGIVK